MKAEKKKNPLRLLAPLYCYKITVSYITFHSPPKICHVSTKYRFKSKKEIEVYFVEIQRNLCTNFGVGSLGSTECCLSRFT